MLWSELGFIETDGPCPRRNKEEKVLIGMHVSKRG
jgi:hypothetical protein